MQQCIYFVERDVAKQQTKCGFNYQPYKFETTVSWSKNRLAAGPQKAYRCHMRCTRMTGLNSASSIHPTHSESMDDKVRCAKTCR